MTREEKVLQLKQDFDEVHEAGKQAEYDAFWDSYLSYAKNTGIGHFLFAGGGWNENTKLPYNIDFITDGYNMFLYCGNIPKSELAKIDFSKITINFPSFAYSNKITEIPELDTRGVSSVGSLFAYCASLKRIDNIIFKDDGSQTGLAMFALCNSLEELRCTGKIGQSGMDLHWSTKLSKASIESIIEHLIGDTPYQLTITLSLAAVNKAFETSEGANDGATSSAWTDLRDTRMNWTISLT